MRWKLPAVFLISLIVPMTATELLTSNAWTQWAANPQHSGFSHAIGQQLRRKLAEVRYDPFVKQETKDFYGAGVPVHYQVPLIDGNEVYMEFKTGKWIACHPPTAWVNGAHCGPNAWDSEIWNEKRMDWKDGRLVESWTFTSDWKPEPDGNPTYLDAWEPVFHPALAPNFLYVPGFAGTIWKVNKQNGKALSRINPFGKSLDPHTFVSGPLTVDSKGDVYYNVIKLANVKDPWYANDVKGAWLVKVTPEDETQTVTYHTLVPNAPPPDAQCPFMFYNPKTLPWPPSKKSKPTTVLCGSQRPGINVAPAVAPDGTIYTLSRAHYGYMVSYSYLVAVNPDLTPKWQASMQRLLHDGCGVIVPIATRKRQPNACREGSNQGVDPTTNDWGSGYLVDTVSSSPSIAPDGSILVGIRTNYDRAGSHLLKFTSAGQVVGAYPYGFDMTATIFPHDATYSMMVKENHYPVGLYCNFPNNVYCRPLSQGPYYITQLGADMKPEWKYKDPTVDKQHPLGYEWCVNAAAIDKKGTVFVNSEDGHLYAVAQGGKLLSKMFLKLAIGAAYTPSSIGPDGKIYTQNYGELFVLGQQ